jgi:hypothetical protein
MHGIKLKQPQALLGSGLFLSLTLFCAFVEELLYVPGCSRGGSCWQSGLIDMFAHDSTRYFLVIFFSLATLLFTLKAFQKPNSPPE